MKKLVIISLVVLGVSFFNSCTPDSVTDQEYEEFQATDKKDSVNSSGGTQPDDEDNSEG
ncbi:hypothetical protein IMCC3317_11350 [Kordia antarctica]|uniref:Secreted protein n=1 Tax=Kordia antarctica TaxID=1218801 RepID=A0A7L4ZH46_9FLAO|nr:hypothetical protein [Kordia antarctica]QHI35787.1 hypothetical protein IMCC3317_11350 [Kordia antarctica]